MIANANPQASSSSSDLIAQLGHHADVDYNSVPNPGSIIGRGSVVYPNTSWRGILPANMIAKNKAAQEIIVRRVRKM